MAATPATGSTVRGQTSLSPPDEWSPPLLVGDFHSAFGSSVIEEFVAGHNVTDVLRELVQNEFDAGGEKLSISFGADHLSVRGNGKTIDASGWSRLSLLLGTGRVIGQDHEPRTVQPKLNSIGSKNFGLRSLFIFGDRIYVRSDGQMAVLDLPALGTQKIPDPSSRGLKGVRVHVPYRARSFQRLEEFSVGREREAFERMADAMLPTLVKLALPGVRKGIRELHISSERIGRRLHWRQTAVSLRCRVKGVSAIRRLGVLIDSLPESGRARTRKFEEIEFSRLVAIPGEYSGVQFPAYFRSGKGLRVSVSLSTKGKRANGATAGRCYYPLAVEHSLTGTAISVNAPFQLDSDRSKVLDTNWNRWLTKQSAELACDLLVDDWFSRFGADAYIAVLAKSDDSTWFLTHINAYLKTAKCWPTQAATGRASVVTEAAQLVIPLQEELGGFLSDDRYLHDRLASNASVTELVLRCGAKPFTTNSLVRLRCASSKDEMLSTRVPTGEANYHYNNYQSALNDERRQAKMAAALTKLTPKLSNQNRKDLKDTSSTLAANGSLQAAGALYRVPDGIWDVCPVPLSLRLHSKLRDHKGISRYSAAFKTDEWIIDAADRAAQGAIAEHERMVLYHYLLEDGLMIGRKALSAIRRSPVLKDHEGRWARPDELVLLSSAQFELMAPVIRSPSKEVIDAVHLVDRLRIRRRIIGDDLLSFAKYVAESSQRVSDFEEFLTENMSLLSLRIVEQLKSIPFLRARSGILSEPERLHIRTQANVACIDDDDCFVHGTNVNLYRRLGCSNYPSTLILLNSLYRRRSQGVEPPKPEKFYQALVEAFRRERLQTSSYEDELILWVNGAYRCPHETLVGANVPRFFELALPVFRGAASVGHAYLQLGANAHPTERHWGALFLHFHEQHSGQAERLSNEERRALREAYQRRGQRGLPETLPDTALCLLSRDATLHSLRELNARTFIQDDYPELGTALRANHADIAFADWIDSTADFFAALRVARLTEVCQTTRISVGPECSAPHWFQAVRRSEVLEVIRRVDFAAAVRALALASQRRDSDFRPVQTREINARLSRVENIAFASLIERTYRFGKVDASIGAEGAITENRVVLLPARSLSEFQQMMASVLAELVGAKRVSDLRSLAVLIFPLLQCRSSRDMASYLRRQGIQGQTLLASDEVEETLSFEYDAIEEEQSVSELILRGIVSDLNTHPSVNNVRQFNDESGAEAVALEHAPEAEVNFSLPSITQVTLTLIKQSSDWTVPIPGSTTGKSRRGPWSPPSTTEIERDRQIGHRGEELVYRYELERLRALGYDHPEEHVVWTSLTDPGADHDIKSIAEDGRPLWIEVKSTVGTDGRFEWPKKEFEKALVEGNSYELWRVYQAHTDQPSTKRFRNPLALIPLSALKLELGTLRAVLEPLTAP